MLAPCVDTKALVREYLEIHTTRSRLFPALKNSAAVIKLIWRGDRHVESMDTQTSYKTSLLLIRFKEIMLNASIQKIETDSFYCDTLSARCVTSERFNFIRTHRTTAHHT